MAASPRTGLQGILAVSALMVLGLLLFAYSRDSLGNGYGGYGEIQAPPPDVRRDLFAYQDQVIKDILQLGQVTDSNFYRWSVLKRLLLEDQRARGSRDPFIILEYGSNLGSISVPIASTFQRATLISVESGDIEPAQRRSMPYEAKVMGKIKFHSQVLSTLGIDNNPVCKATVTKQTLERLRTARLRFDYQLLLDFMHHVDVSTFGELASFLQALAALARITVIEIPRLDAEDAHLSAWYAKGSASQTARAALASLPHISVRTLAGGPKTLQLLAIENSDIDEGVAIPIGRQLCREVFKVLHCSNALLESWCPGNDGDASPQQAGGDRAGGADNRGDRRPDALRPDAIRHGGHGVGGGQQKAAPTTTTTRRPATNKKSPVKPIPPYVCGQRRGVVVEKVGECGQRRPQREWTWENDGWYKCRNATHWLTGCMRMPS